MANTVESLSDLLADLRGEPRYRIYPSSRLREDLGIEGDDWDEILVAVTSRWHTNFEGFVFRDYFMGEPHLFTLLAVIKDFVTGRRLKPLTVAHLAEVIDKGKWFEPRPTPA